MLCEVSYPHLHARISPAQRLSHLDSTTKPRFLPHYCFRRIAPLRCHQDWLVFGNLPDDKGACHFAEYSALVGKCFGSKLMLNSMIAGQSKPKGFGHRGGMRISAAGRILGHGDSREAHNPFQGLRTCWQEQNMLKILLTFRPPKKLQLHHPRLISARSTPYVGKQTAPAFRHIEGWTTASRAQQQIVPSVSASPPLSTKEDTALSDNRNCALVMRQRIHTQSWQKKKSGGKNMTVELHLPQPLSCRT